MSEQRVHLIVPGLLRPRLPGATQAGALAKVLLQDMDLARLEHALAQARRSGSVLARDGCSELLYDAFGLTRDAQGDWPSGALRYALEDRGAPPAAVVCADPVHLAPDGGKLNLSDAETFVVDQRDADALIDDLNAHFSAQGLRFEAPAPTRWYLHLRDPPRIRTHALADVVGNMDGALPHGPDGPHWHGLLNEAQMILHASKANQSRAERAEVPINSVWFWGAGVPPTEALAARYDHVQSDDLLARALARRAGASDAPLLPDGHELIAGARAGGNTLVTIGDCYRPCLLSDVEAWRDAVARVNERWLTPLINALDSGLLTSVSLRADRGLVFHLDRWARFKFWRRRRPLVTYAHL